MSKNVIKALVIASAVSFAAVSGVANADKKLDDVKRSVAQYPEITYAMMGDVVFLHGSTDHIPELNNIVAELMQIEGVSEVRANIFSK